MSADNASANPESPDIRPNAPGLDAVSAHLRGRGKEFEYLTSTYDPVYSQLVDAINVVKEFIIERELIVYGGSAIDYALRLHGDKIYPDDMLTVPDLDFYSPKNVEHAYELATILYGMGHNESRAINAQHMETMRVDLMSNHWIADITYRPEEIFRQLPYIVYNGMRIIHPDFQRIDVHSSLSFPYDNPPREVIFDRWTKDIERFNILDKYYPIKAPKETIPLRLATVLRFGRYVLSGFAAYAVIYNQFVREMKQAGVDPPVGIIPAQFGMPIWGPDGKPVKTGAHAQTGDNGAGTHALVFDTLDQTIDIIHFDIDKAAREIVGESGNKPERGSKRYEPYINLTPLRIEIANIQAGEVRAVIHSTKNRLVAVNSVEVNVGDPHVRVVGVQYLLKYFLSMYFVHGGNSLTSGGSGSGGSGKTSKLAGTYLARYVSLLAMIRARGVAGTFGPDSILFPSVTTYGRENINLAREIALDRVQGEMTGAPTYRLPQNFYPARAATRGIGPPAFNPADIIFFQESGREITI